MPNDSIDTLIQKSKDGDAIAQNSLGMIPCESYSFCYFTLN